MIFIRYSDGSFHGYDKHGQPCLVGTQHAAAGFQDKDHALRAIAHDGTTFDFWGGGFHLLTKTRTA